MAKKSNSANTVRSCRSLRAVEEFSCIGGDCENTCCQSWKVTLTKSDYVTWRNLAKKEPEQVKLFKEHVPKGAKGDLGYATLAFDKQTGKCPFHNEQGLCGVQSALGAEAIPATCRTFPKMYNIDKSALQVNASLACPEYVRNVLSSDSATDVIEVGMPSAGTQIMNLSSSGKQWHWQRCLPEIGELGLSIVKSNTLDTTLAERLFSVGVMMDQIEDIGSEPSNPMTLQLLSQRISPILDAGARREMAHQFRELDIVDNDLGLQFVVSMYAYRLSVEWKDMAPLWDGIYASYRDAVSLEMQIVPGEYFGVDVEDLAPIFKERKRKLHSRAGKDLQRWYTRAFCNQFFSGGAASEETPVAYLGRHVLTVMMIDFAICSHEDVDALLAGEGPLSEDELALLKKHVVNIIHRVGRTVLHVGHITSSLASVMASQEVPPLAIVTTMLKELDGDRMHKPMQLNPIAAMMQ